MNRYFCTTDGRRRAALEGSGYNGIDYLEVGDSQTSLVVTFVNAITPGALAAQHFRVEGGERIRDIRVQNVRTIAGDPERVELTLDKAGDFSRYRLRLVDPNLGIATGFRIDPIFAVVDFSFKIHCPSDRDCALAQRITASDPRAPEIDYLAKDYASFRRLMLDRLAALTPDADIPSPGDIRMTLVELLAYVGDYLSYQQDAIATEAYLDTARRRVSVRRHARLVDYAMHDGANARVWVQIQVSRDNLYVPARTRLLSRLSGQHAAAIGEEALHADSVDRIEVFETLHEAQLARRHNEMRFYTWGADACCLPRGSTRASLRGKLDLKAGDVLLLVEKTGPSGTAADANPDHRHAVRLIAVDNATEDPLGARLDAPGGGVDQPLPLTEIEWHPQDAIPFPLCLSTEQASDLSIALGNIVLADHGRPVVDEPLGQVPAIDPTLARPTGALDRSTELTRENTAPRYRPELQGKPITCATPYDSTMPEGDLRSAYSLRNIDPACCLPEIELREVETGIPWQPRRELLNSGPLANEFVAEIESDGAAYLRFGDDRYGRRPPPGTTFTASYRVGNGPAGNLGANAIAHLVVPKGLDPNAILWVTNPLPALGGVAPETIADARAKAPYAFRRQERAVTPEDYADLTARHPEVQRAAARLRWTGSWSTLFVAVDRKGREDIDAPFKRKLRSHLEQFRLAGHDVEIESPRYVPLEVDMRVRVKPGYKRADVAHRVAQVFSRDALPNGRAGVFHPDRFTFEQPVYLSHLYAAADTIEGIEAVEIERFQRQGLDDPGPVQTGKLPIGQFEIARLDNDPNHPERGRFQFRLEGGL